jgi:hypothetical protein
MNEKEVFKKAKAALRKHILENQEQVIKDLDEMRKNSKGNDIESYVKEITILSIKNRISSEYAKHKNHDWATIAANKIYSEYFVG